MIDLESLMGRAVATNASDIHLTVGLPPVLRVDGELPVSYTHLRAHET